MRTPCFLLSSFQESWWSSPTVTWFSNLYTFFLIISWQPCTLTLPCFHTVRKWLHWCLIFNLLMINFLPVGGGGFFFSTLSGDLSSIDFTVNGSGIQENSKPPSLLSYLLSSLSHPESWSLALPRASLCSHAVPHTVSINQHLVSWDASHLISQVAAVALSGNCPSMFLWLDLKSK